MEALTRDAGRLHAFLDSGSTRGRTNVVPALYQAHALLTGQGGDRVVAVFGDGDLGDAAGAGRKSDAMRAEDIGITSRGLGLASAQSADVISTKTTGGGPRVADADDVADSIAGMAGGLRRAGRR